MIASTLGVSFTYHTSHVQVLGTLSNVLDFDSEEGIVGLVVFHIFEPSFLYSWFVYEIP